MQAAIFYIINILLSPITLIGFILQTIAVYGRRKSGVSVMAQAPLTDRWLQHKLGTRLDEPVNRLLMVLPGVPLLGYKLGYGPMLLAHRVSGYVPKSYLYPFAGEITLGNQRAARQTFYDSVLERYLPDIAQLVILGAGFDTRAFRLTLPPHAHRPGGSMPGSAGEGVPKDQRVRSFEVDTPKTSAAKREALEKANIDTTEVTFVAADFEKEDWLTQLVEAGFDPSKPTLFIWEGVMMYLDRETVEATLRKVASTAKGSVIAFDYFTSEVLESQTLFMRTVRASLNSFGEPLKFGIDSTPPSREHLAELLKICGLTLAEQRTLGQETEGKRAWGGFAVAVVK
jgi:O-methyltransferase involved in polyketide biosynthesis